MRDVLDTLERWTGEGLRFATATVVKTERSAPRDPGAVLAGGPPRLVTYGIADEEAFEVGLPCGGTVHIFVDLADPAVVHDLDPLGLGAAARRRHRR